jgi:hypothetical protein
MLISLIGLESATVFLDYFGFFSLFGHFFHRSKCSECSQQLSALEYRKKLFFNNTLLLGSWYDG